MISNALDLAALQGLNGRSAKSKVNHTARVAVISCAVCALHGQITTQDLIKRSPGPASTGLSKRGLIMDQIHVTSDDGIFTRGCHILENLINKFRGRGRIKKQASANSARERAEHEDGECEVPSLYHPAATRPGGELAELAIL